MKTTIEEDVLTITFEKETVDNLSDINQAVKNIPSGIKSVIIDLDKVKYINSIFIDYIFKFNSILNQNNTKLIIANCLDKINELIKKIDKNHDIDIQVKEI